MELKGQDYLNSLLPRPRVRENMIKLTPSEFVIYLLGVRSIARYLKLNPATVCRWQNHVDGHVPKKYYGQLMQMAKDYGLCLTENGLKYGGEIKL